MWKKVNNLPVKIKFLCHCHFINWEKSGTCWSSCRTTRVISTFIVRALRNSCAFIHTRTLQETAVLNLTPVVLIEDHTRWCGPLLLTPRVLTLTPHFLQCIRERAKRTWFWHSLNTVYDQLASNQKHPFIASIHVWNVHYSHTNLVNDHIY